MEHGFLKYRISIVFRFLLTVRFDRAMVRAKDKVLLDGELRLLLGRFDSVPQSSYRLTTAFPTKCHCSIPRRRLTIGNYESFNGDECAYVGTECYAYHNDLQAVSQGVIKGLISDDSAE